MMKEISRFSTRMLGTALSCLLLVAFALAGEQSPQEILPNRERSRSEPLDAFGIQERSQQLSLRNHQRSDRKVARQYISGCNPDC